MEEMSYVFSFTFFITTAHFLLVLVAASISHFVTAPTKFSCCSSNKKCLLCFLSLALDLLALLPFFSLSFSDLPLFLFFCLSLALYSKCVDMTINLSLKLLKTRIQKQFSLFGFVFIDSLVTSALQTRVAIRFPS